jgi:hypothetical protein
MWILLLENMSNFLLQKRCDTDPRERSSREVQTSSRVGQRNEREVKACVFGLENQVSRLQWSQAICLLGVGRLVGLEGWSTGIVKNYEFHGGMEKRWIHEL